MPLFAAELSLLRVRRTVLLLTSAMPEPFLSNQSHKPFESESSKKFLSRVMTWSSRVRVESQELSSHFELLVCKLESMSSQKKFTLLAIGKSVDLHL